MDGYHVIRYEGEDECDETGVYSWVENGNVDASRITKLDLMEDMARGEDRDGS